MRNNIIAIIAISFTIVGTMWAIRNIIYSNNGVKTLNEGIGILLVAKDNLFNSTNPDIHASTTVPLRITISNQDFVKHDLVVDDLNINTGYIPSGRDFKTAIASKDPGNFEYYCSIHPDTMRGRIIIDD
jgi:heme/copper-type cytochrome/quinol oxidase subunit 2